MNHERAKFVVLLGFLVCLKRAVIGTDDLLPLDYQDLTTMLADKFFLVLNEILKFLLHAILFRSVSHYCSSKNENDHNEGHRVKVMDLA